MPNLKKNAPKILRRPAWLPKRVQHPWARALGAMIVAHFLFTTMFACLKFLAREQTRLEIPLHSQFGAGEAVWLRSVLMGAVCWWRLKKHEGDLTAAFLKLPTESKQWLAVRGGIGALSMAAVFYASIHVPLAINSILTNLNVFFIGFFAHVFLGERVGLRAFLFSCAGFAGAALVLQQHISSDDFSSPGPIIASLLSAFFSAIAYFSVRRMKSLQADWIILSLSVAGTLLPLCYFIWTGHVGLNGSPYLWGLLVATVVPGIAAQFFMTASFKAAPAFFVSQGQFLAPVFSALFGFFFFSERLTPLECAGGMIVIFFGVLLPASNLKNQVVKSESSRLQG